MIVLGFILFLLFLVLLLAVLLLFVPVRYVLDGSFIEGKPDGTAALSWLFGALRGTVTWHHGVMLSGSIRLFGMKLFDLREAEHERTF